MIQPAFHVPAPRPHRLNELLRRLHSIVGKSRGRIIHEIDGLIDGAFLVGAKRQRNVPRIPDYIDGAVAERRRKHFLPLACAPEPVMNLAKDQRFLNGLHERGMKGRAGFFDFCFAQFTRFNPKVLVELGMVRDMCMDGDGVNIDGPVGPKQT